MAAIEQDREIAEDIESVIIETRREIADLNEKIGNLYRKISLNEKAQSRAMVRIARAEPAPDFAADHQAFATALLLASAGVPEEIPEDVPIQIAQEQLQRWLTSLHPNLVLANPVWLADSRTFPIVTVTDTSAVGDITTLVSALRAVMDTATDAMCAKQVFIVGGREGPQFPVVRVGNNTWETLHGPYADRFCSLEGLLLLMISKPC